MHETHARSLAWLDERIEAGSGMQVVLEQAVGHLRSSYPHYDWVGIYVVEGDRLRLWSWDGPAPTQHVEISLHQGVCGFAASTGQIANVPDVSRDRRYLECFLGTRSELVVPIRSGDRVFGEVDIDSDRLAAFTPDDEAFLAVFCQRLARLAESSGLAGHKSS